MTKAKHPNRLASEKSPYLLQHAHNPVDWYPWGDEAFEKARQEQKPIFLSIGYSTCHWCHVMEQESFEDPEVASLINEVFVPIKVDREERPDLDHLYMTVCQMMSGSGGWPLTVIMTPEKIPFFVGTYFAKEDTSHRVGLKTLIQRIRRVWKEDSLSVHTATRQLTEKLTRLGAMPHGTPLHVGHITLAAEELMRSFDVVHGGFGSAPKFPSPHRLLFLLRYHDRTKNMHALTVVEKTLDAMREGGIFDQVGYGFHRYATNDNWLVPHFEKMLYDQALLMLAYTETYQQTKNPKYARVVREMVIYVLREMEHEEGGYYSAQDADSEGAEGKFYTWTVPNIRLLLGEEDSRLACEIFGVVPEGNYTDPVTGTCEGKNILHLPVPLLQMAKKYGMALSELENRLDNIRSQLYQARLQRTPLHQDDKMLTDWNGLMIAALARASRVMGDIPEALISAQKAAVFLLNHVLTPDERLIHRYRDGQAAMPGVADDYAFLIWGFLELYQATADTIYLTHALRLQHVMINDFWDTREGAFFLASHRVQDVFVRLKEAYDGATPSANSIAMMNLLILGHISGNSDWIRKAESLGATFAGVVEANPSAYTALLTAVDSLKGPFYVVVMVGDFDFPATQAVLREIQHTYLPRTYWIFKRLGEDQDLVKLLPWLASYTAQDESPTFYLCQEGICQAPTQDFSLVLARLQ